MRHGSKLASRILTDARLYLKEPKVLNYERKTIMYTINNFTNNDDIRILNQLGPFTVIEYVRDLSVMPSEALLAYYCNEMNVRKRQVICDLKESNITLHEKNQGKAQRA